MNRQKILEQLEVVLDNAATCESVSFSVSASKREDGTFHYYVDSSYDVTKDETTQSSRKSQSFSSPEAL
jgi:hypothetical protein